MIRLQYPLILAISASVLVFAGFSIYEVIALNVMPFDRFSPRFDAYYLFKSLACVTLSLWIALLIPNDRFVLDSNSSKRINAFSILSIGQIVGVLFIFLYSKKRFYFFAKENGLVETASFVCALIGSICLLISILHFCRTRALGPCVTAALFSALMFLIAMEEVSWMQQYFRFETPTAFEGNIQNETNLHNFASKTANNLYYGGGFFLLVFGAFAITPMLRFQSAGMRCFLPHRAVAISCVFMSACNWEMWNNFAIQMMFWISVFIMVRFYRGAFASFSISGFLLVLLLISFIIAQLIFLFGGNSMIRTHDLEEYREGLIAFGLMIFAIDVFRQSKSISKAGQDTAQ